MPHAKVIVLACSESKADELRSRLHSLGAEVLLFPAIKIRPLAVTADVLSTIAHLNEYDWLIFTSAHAPPHFGHLLETAGVRVPAALRVCAIGPATADAARAAGFPVHLVPERFVAEGVVEAFSGAQPTAGLRILLPRARKARDVIPSALQQAGARVDVLPVYETVQGDVPEQTLERIRGGRTDLLVFTSSSTVANFLSILGEHDGRGALARNAVAALGPITAQTLGSCGKQPEIVPRENTIPSLVAAIAAHWAS